MRKRARRQGALALLGATAVVLAGCADGPSTSQSGGQGVKAGATKQEYVEAFEDVDPITVVTQTTGPKGAPAGAHFEAYHAAINEWSGGKIKFDVSYSNAIAAPDEAADALTDGRLDMVNVQTVHQPEEFPANNALVDVSFVGEHTPVVGQMQALAWMNEVAYESPEMSREFEDRGMRLLLPAFHGGSPTFMCKKKRTSLDTMEGAQSVASGKSATEQLKALGATPVSMAYPEIYESLQRGVVDCVEGSFTIAVLGGYIDSAPNVVVDPEVGFAKSPGSLAMSQDAWEGMPLVAQQLFHDRLDTFVSANVASILKSSADGVAAVQDAGGELQVFEEDVREELRGTNESLLKKSADAPGLEDGDAFVKLVEESSGRWRETLTVELNYQSDIEYAEWPDIHKGGVDRKAFVDKFSSDVLAAHRPE